MERRNISGGGEEGKGGCGAVAWRVYSEGGGVEALMPGVCTVKLMV